MKLLFSLDKYLRRSGGADRLGRAVVRVLAEAGHEVRVCQVGPTNVTEVADGVQVESLRLQGLGWVRDGDATMLRQNRVWEELLAERLAIWRPDWVLTQNRLAPASVAAARAAGVRSCIFFHGYRCLSPTYFEGEDARQAARPTWRTVPWRYRLKWPLVKRALSLYDVAYRKADVVVANSQYVAAVVERFFDRPAAVQYPIVDLAVNGADGVGRGDPKRGPVLFVKPQAIKGISLLPGIARRLLKERFLVVGQCSARRRRTLERCANLEVRGWVDGMADVYASASLLLVPSRIPEPFGRVVVEAALAGVPAVVSNWGGLPEAVGGGGVTVGPGASPAEWARAVEEALAPGRHASLAAAAREHAAALLAAHGPEHLLGLLT